MCRGDELEHPHLLVEDDDVDAQFVRRSLKDIKEDINLIHCENGAEAVRYLDSINPPKRTQPMLVLLDLNMPEMNGFEFLETIRSKKHQQNLIIFILSTSNYWEDKIKTYRYNIAGYLQKRKINQRKNSLSNLIQFYREYVEFPPDQYEV